MCKAINTLAAYYENFKNGKFTNKNTVILNLLGSFNFLTGLYFRGCVHFEVIFIHEVVLIFEVVVNFDTGKNAQKDKSLYHY